MQLIIIELLNWFKYLYLNYFTFLNYFKFFRYLNYFDYYSYFDYFNHSNYSNMLILWFIFIILFIVTTLIILNILVTRISGPYGPLKILAPARACLLRSQECSLRSHPPPPHRHHHHPQHLWLSYKKACQEKSLRQKSLEPKKPPAKRPTLIKRPAAFPPYPQNIFFIFLISKFRYSYFFHPTLFPFHCPPPFSFNTSIDWKNNVPLKYF